MAMKRDEAKVEKRLCEICGTSERWFLHYVRHKGAIRKLCTHCVLKANPGQFCPICLEFFEQPLPVRERVMCLKCPSISHSACVVANSSFHGFQCPPCSNTTYSFFTLNRHNDSADAKPTFLIDKTAAKALVGAAKIAADLMAKNAVSARSEAERRVKEAVAAKKRAKDALDRLSSLVNQEKDLKTGGVGSTPESLIAKPKLECPAPIQALPKIVAPEGNNGFGGDQLKRNHGDPMDED